VYDIRDRSEAWKAWVSSKKSCPWVTDEGEMIRKTIIKRASKYWPKTDRLDQAIHYLNTDGEEGLANAPAQPEPEKAVFDQVAWLEKVRCANKVADLQKVWAEGVKAAEQARDKPGYIAFKQAVIERKNVLEGVVDVQ